MTVWDLIILSIPIVILITTILYYGLTESFNVYGNPFSTSLNDPIEIKMEKNKKPIKTIRINFFLFFMILLGYLLVIFLPLDVYPENYYVKETAVRIDNILRTLLSIEGSLLGLLFAVTVLTYNSSRDIIGSLALTRFLASNRLLFNYFTLLTGTILISFLSIVFLSYIASYKDINSFIVCSLLFSSVVLGLIFLIKQTLSNSSSLKFIEELIDDINIDSINEIDEKQRIIPDNQLVNIVLSNPIYLLSTVLKNSIDREDYITAHVIFRKSVDKSLELIGSSPDRAQCDSIVISFNIIWDIVLVKFTHKPNIAPLMTVYLVLFSKYHEHWLENNLSLDLLDAHFEIINDVNNSLIKNGNENLMNHFSWSYENFFIRTLVNNTPPENQIWEINYIVGDKYSIVKDEEIASTNQWENLNGDFLNLLMNQLSNAIGYKKPKIFDNAIRTVDMLISRIDSANAEESKKHLLIVRIMSMTIYEYKNALDTGLFKTTDECNFIGAQIINELVEKNRKYYPLVVNSYFDGVIKIASDKQLGKYFQLSINLGAIGRFTSSRYNEDSRYSETFNLFIKLIEKLRVIIEPDYVEFYDQYLFLIDALESCKRVYSDKYGEDSDSKNFNKIVDDAILKFIKRSEAMEKSKSLYLE